MEGRGGEGREGEGREGEGREGEGREGGTIRILFHLELLGGVRLQNWII